MRVKYEYRYGRVQYHALFSKEKFSYLMLGTWDLGLMPHTKYF